jgi:hypothetical protein
VLPLKWEDVDWDKSRIHVISNFVSGRFGELNPAAATGDTIERTVSAAISHLCWAAVLWFRDMTLVLVAGAVALGFLVSESYRLWVCSVVVRSAFCAGCLGLAWLATLVLICMRVVRVNSRCGGLSGGGQILCAICAR